MKKKILWALALASSLSLAGCNSQPVGETSSTTTAGTSSQTSDSIPSKTVITYGKSQGPYTELFEAAIIPILENQGYTLKEVEFSDLLTADVALNDGDIDVNVEQHIAYLENFNTTHSGNLTPVSPIPTVPAGIYSSTHKSLEEIAAGAKIAVPDDASNTARAYLLLQKIGWIKLKDSVNPTSVTEDDIEENPYHLVFTEMKSLTIPAAMEDFDFVVLTGSIVYNAKIDPFTALETEDVLERLVLQVVVKEENKDADWAKAIAEAYHSDSFKAYMKENNKGLWWIPAELQ